MKGIIEWNEKLPEGGRRFVRVSLDARTIKWQFKLPTQDKWDYESKPTAEDWARLIQELEDRCQRDRISPQPIALARKFRSEAGFSS